jgi:abscisic-aldehyde oxidase
MSVSLFGALVNAEKSSSPEPPTGFSKIAVSGAEKAISGNLCRCTGYRPIADACKSFATDVDMEDLGLNSFWRKGESKDRKLSKLPRYDHNHKNIKFPMFLKDIKHDLFIASEKHSWHKPTSLKELQNLLELSHANEIKIKVVVNNTGMGYYKDKQGYDKYIDLSGISELSKIKKYQSGIEIGAAVTISKAIEVLKVQNKNDFNSDFVMILEKIADHMNKVASGFIRNTASVGGNLVMAQKSKFPSDIATILLAVDSMVHIMTGSKFEWFALEEFLKRPPLGLESVVLSIKIPSLESSETKSRYLFETYRASPRPLGNALSHLNAAFLVQVSPCKDSEGTIIDNCRLTFGGFKNKHAIRAKNVEEFLAGKLLSVRNLYDAINLLTVTTTSIIPRDETSKNAYLLSLAVGFLFQFFNSLIASPAKINNGYSNGHTNFPSVEASQNHAQPNIFPTLLSSGKQILESGSEYRPVGEPVTKSGAVIQASGLFRLVF